MSDSPHSTGTLVTAAMVLAASAGLASQRTAASLVPAVDAAVGALSSQRTAASLVPAADTSVPSADRLAAYSVRVDWGSGPDPFPATFSGAYDELVGQDGYGVRSIRIHRGRDDDLGLMAAGEATIVIHDPDGRFNPLNSASPLAGLAIPMRQVSIRARNDGVNWRDVFYGYVRLVEHNPDPAVRETTIHAQDFFLWMSRVSPVLSVGMADVMTTGTQIAALVSATNTSVGMQLSADSGDALAVGLETTGNESALSLVGKLLETERGVFYIRSDGRPVFIGRNSRHAASSLATITNTMTQTRTGTDLERVANRARVTFVDRAGDKSLTQTAENAVSQAKYGLADAGDIESPHLSGDGQALALAQFIVSQQAEPRPPIWGLDLINRSGADLTQMLRRELADRVTITAEGAGLSAADYVVESIEHDISDGGMVHRTCWMLSEFPGDHAAHAFLIGFSTFGPAGTDTLVY